MFTGLIEEIGKLLSRRGGELEIQAALARDLPLGASVATNGICLTATRVVGDRFWADISPSTLAVTTAGAWAPGQRLQLERALALGDRLDGHLVAGHVDGVGQILAKRRLGPAWQLEFSVPRELAIFLVPRGSIALDGTSLTLTEVGPDRAAVTLIPHTASRTVLLDLEPGARVNLETDMLAKYVHRMLGAPEGPGLTRAKLAQYGFGG